ncbi:MAG TPA: DnaJ domain-containing protein [Methylocystis sp.]|jgi:curved DNA-binding protein CbpA
MRTHYEVLGVKEDATRREISAAYRQLVKRHHPDKGGDPAKFQQITQAYDALRSEPERKARGAQRKSASALDKAAGKRTLLQRVKDFLNARAFAALSALSFLLGVFLIDAGDGVNEGYNPFLLAAGGVSILLCVGFFANRGQPYKGLWAALLRTLFSILYFLFDVMMRLYVILALIFSVVVLVALLNWLKKNYLHFLPPHF